MHKTIALYIIDKALYDEDYIVGQFTHWQEYL